MQNVVNTYAQDYIFERCREINNNITVGNESIARDSLIQLLDYHKLNEIEYIPLVNHLIRQTGLYPYLIPETSNWQDRYVFEAFKADIGIDEKVTLHREQSSLLKKLLDGESIAVSAPTSFGKSFVIDAFISIKKPDNIVVIVPTIALTDETRRRLYKKFAHEYKIITTSDVTLAKKNILIFPQERAINYINILESIDLLVIDEFYKASAQFEKDRSPSLLKAILQLGKMAKQRYFLAPNIGELNDNLFTKDVKFYKLDFNTVYLEKHNYQAEINGDETLKSLKLLEILDKKKTKTLIYAGTYSEIGKLSNLFIDKLPVDESPLLQAFATWLEQHYSANWSLTSLIRRGSGVHNGRLHRSLSQIQVRLFESHYGIHNIISTSSIIEGVNTSAENVVLWRNLSGKNRWATINDFTYKNIIGRGGRMFKHFIGKIYILDEPPVEENMQLILEFPDELVNDVDPEEFKNDLTNDQIAKIISFKRDMTELLGAEVFNRLQKENKFHITNGPLLLEIVKDMIENRNSWNGFGYLNNSDPQNWNYFLHKILPLQKGWDTSHTIFVEFVKALSSNWSSTIPTILRNLAEHDITIEDFFKLERNATYKLASLLHDINILYKEVIGVKPNSDVSPFISKLSHAFLPTVVYQLEEYGMPRMISRKIHDSGLINFIDPELTIHSVIDKFNNLGIWSIRRNVTTFDRFDIFVLKYFYQGIEKRNNL
ncbi:DEAD/DEAH box helicase [Flavobacterium sp. DG1-102-2]|uniref:DEAD/DEAH box helicase n=1 Tax=Flavobacterium sp. DG1-102-2 TaxID=3081663 RepID=UPI00294A2B8A|nr:DEAD/DEAH box helicase [Flavobacterium sp. DG1-102-2]MDV6167869.1 DEAD/DEAH box helicase [Flavobacterium sp. DG1-102-2]